MKSLVSIQFYNITQGILSNFTCPNDLEFPSDFSKCKQNNENALKLVSLYPPFQPGPSEQTHAFRDVVLAALETQSNLAVSPFTIHIRDKLSKQSKVPLGLRIDLEKLCGIIALSRKPLNIDLVGFVKKGDRIERKPIRHFLKSYLGFHEVYADMIMERNENFDIPSAAFSDFPKSGSDNFTKFLQSSGVNLMKNNFVVGIANAHHWIYRDVYKLIDSGGVYRFGNPLMAKSEPPNVGKLKAKVEYGVSLERVKLVYANTVPPKFIRDLVDIYFEEYEVSNFIGVHWRYNPDDFFDKHVESFTKKKLKNSNNRGLPLRLVNELQKVIQNASYLIEKIPCSSTESTIIIASPFNMGSKFAEAASRFDYKILTTKNSKDFLWKYRTSCQVIKDFFGEVLSIFEKEIMLRSSIFYRSRPSNWSFNVQGMRWATKSYEQIENDRIVFDLFVTKNCSKKCLNSNKLE